MSGPIPETQLGLRYRLLMWYGRRFPLERGKSRITKWVFLRQARWSQTVLGDIPGSATMELWPWLWSDFCALMMGGAERYHMLYLSSRLTDDAVFFDVGAYLAGYGFLAAGRAPHGTVHVFEPNPESARRIADAIERSNFNNMRLNRTAVGRRPGFATLSIHQVPTQSGMQPVSSNTTEAIEVPVTTLDSYCDERAVERLDFIKIDVEGFELDVLQGGRQTIARFRPEVMVELHGPQATQLGVDPRDAATMLETELDYELFRIRSGLIGPSLLPFRYTDDLERRRRIVIARPRQD